MADSTKQCEGALMLITARPAANRMSLLLGRMYLKLNGIVISHHVLPDGTKNMWHLFNLF